MNPMGMTKSCTQRTKSNRPIKDPAERIDALCVGGGFPVAFLGNPEPNARARRARVRRAEHATLIVFWRNVTAKAKDVDEAPRSDRSAPRLGTSEKVLRDVPSRLDILARPKSPAAALSRHRWMTNPSLVFAPPIPSEIIDAPFGPSPGTRIETLLGVIGRPLLTA